MEDLDKDDLNSWLRRAYFSKTVYHRLVPLQASMISLAKLKFGSSTMPTLKSNPDVGFTGVVQGGSDFRANKTGPASKNRAMSDMFKEVKETVRRWFVGPPSRERTGAKTVKSSSRPKKENRWLQKYFDCGVCQVSALEKSSEVQ